MNKKLVYDIEANGLYEEATEIHCIVFRDIQCGEVESLYGERLTRGNILAILGDYDTLICHNQLRYDALILKKFFNISIINDWNLIDTLVWSKCLYPDRSIPDNCPTSLLNPVTGHLEVVRPHGLEAWGCRVGIEKPKIYDWRYFDMDMLNRCIEDTKINELVYYELCKEAKLEDLYPIQIETYDNYIRSLN